MNRDVSWFLKQTVAHRGASSKDRPENSLAAFEEAVNRGIPIELDVHRLRDGNVVVFHDFDTLRMCGKPGLVKTRNLAGIKKLRLKGSDMQIPTFQEVLDLVDGKVGILIELKTMLTYKKLCDALLKILEGYKGKVAIQCFSQKALSYIAKHSDYPRGIIGMNYRRAGLIGLYGLYLNSMARFKQIDPDFINYNVMHMPSRATKRCKQLGIPVIAWTIKNVKHRELAEKVLADAYITETRYFDD